MDLDLERFGHQLELGKESPRLCLFVFELCLARFELIESAAVGAFEVALCGPCLGEVFSGTTRLLTPAGTE